MEVNGFEVREITWKQERELYRAYKKAFRNSSIDTESGEVLDVNIDWDSYDEVLSMALVCAFQHPEKELKKMSHPEIDALGQQILLRYLQQDDESKKE